MKLVSTHQTWNSKKKKLILSGITYLVVKSWTAPHQYLNTHSSWGSLLWLVWLRIWGLIDSLKFLKNLTNLHRLQVQLMTAYLYLSQNLVKTLIVSVF